MDIRQVVTGAGDAVREERARLLPLPDGGPVAVADVWGSDEVVGDLGSGRRPDYARYFPPVGGFRVLVIEWPPTSTVTEEARTAHRTVRDRAMVGYRDDAIEAVDGTHSTETVDIGVVIEGELTMTVGGVDTVLRPGDLVVQNGTAHAWRNDGDRPCRAAFFVVGARR